MQVDLFGNVRYKVNLHMHTTLSDGKRTPAEAVQIYRSAGYDALALTDHWFYGDEGEADGLTILSGAEYNIGGNDARTGVYHILGIGARRAPSVTKNASPQQLIDAIHAAGGLAVLAHPAWSLNTPEQILALEGLDATEIYNSVSNVHNSRRPDSSVIIDLLGCRGRFYPLLATDDTHYYEAGEACCSWIMVRAENNTRESLLRAFRAGYFYATQGPEVHLFCDGDGYTVRCSPCTEIVFFSNCAWSPRVFTGDGLTEAHYVPRAEESFLRVQVKDSDGHFAWTNCVILPE